MDKTRWNKIEELFHGARKLDEIELNKFLEEACCGDSELRNEVESLLSNDHYNKNTILLKTSLLDEIAHSIASDYSKSLIGKAVGNYKIESLLGEGGMGRVYKVRDLRLDRPVALKFLKGNDSELVERFFFEARAQARIEHNNVCKVYEVGQVEGHPFIVMQYIDGFSLKEIQDQLNIEQKLRSMVDVCEGLHESHRQGLIHRDIKPANIMIERDAEGNWHPYVMDFGLVREINAEGQTVSGVVMGTPSYMSPEQARGDVRRLDRRADVYSLGATLYAILAGKPPFQGSNTVEVVLRVLRDNPEPLRLIDKNIPIDVEKQ
jgi:eukaryotic-like serine/threonine-protein kinase